MRTPSPPYCRLDLAPPLADRFIVGAAPIDYGPLLLLMPFGFHLAMDTLPSRELRQRCPPLSGQRGITPAFGYGAPHPGARGTSTLLNSVLLSTQYGAIRLLSGVHVRRAALGLPGPVPTWEHRRGLPVLGHAVSQRAWGLRLRGITHRLAISSARVWPSPSDNKVGIPI